MGDCLLMMIWVEYVDVATVVVVIGVDVVVVV